MSYIIGAAMLIAAVAFLHVGRIMVQRINGTGSRREGLVLDAFALGFTALFALGLMLMAQNLVADVTMLRVVAFLSAVTGAVIGSRIVTSAFRRAAAGPVADSTAVGSAPTA